MAKEQWLLKNLVCIKVNSRMEISMDKDWKLTKMEKDLVESEITINFKDSYLIKMG